MCVRAAWSVPWHDAEADCREAKKQTCRLEKPYRTSKVVAGDRLHWTANEVLYQRQCSNVNLLIAGSHP